ncbi:hypothetical protein [Rummeliibacillus sp. SL167]|uniref:hypothetical protein n=1 Tax=Rummeliibacillus sp. SL167 TaxID=2579792 RepID=UPI00351A1C85
MKDILIALRSIGIDYVLGYADVDSVMEQAEKLDSYENVTPLEAKEILEKENAELIDVRNLTEFNEVISKVLNISWLGH